MGTCDSGLAWFRAQLGSLSTAWCLGSARFGLEARLSLRLGARLRDLCSAWIGAQLDLARLEKYYK